MKFSQMEYKRPNFEETNAKYKELLKNIKAAKTAEECFTAYNAFNDYNIVVQSMFNLANIRKSLNTKDEFYAAEHEYIEEIGPELEKATQEISKALLESPFRKEMEDAWGKLMFTNLEMEQKTFSPEVIEDLQEENKLSTEWADLMASAVIEFEGKQLNLSKMGPYFQNLDREVRKKAVNTCSDWFMAHSEQLDSIFDALVKVRTRIAKKLGYESFTELGYHRLQRNSYDQNMVAKLREGILKYFVPITTRLKAEQAKRIGVPSITIVDSGFSYPDGNPTPKGTPDEIFEHGKKMYAELSPETSKFFNFMVDNELFDVLTKPNKEVIAYMDYIPMHKSPFIFANFNGTSEDIDLLTHEAGHGYATYMAKDIYPYKLLFGPEDVAEIHAMAMEFFAWPWMEGFFGEDTKKYYHNHISTIVGLFSYGALADEFQHLIYAKPEMTASDRNELWLSLSAKYRPWLDTADIPFWAEGRGWQENDHIYQCPFYYIDYCLAGVVALSFWALSQRDFKTAWAKYNQLVGFAGTKTFMDLVEACDLPNPFEPDNLKLVADMVLEWIEGNGILQ